MDGFYMQGGKRDVTAFTVTIDPLQAISMELSEGCKQAAEEAVALILAELQDTAMLDFGSSTSETQLK